MPARTFRRSQRSVPTRYHPAWVPMSSTARQDQYYNLTQSEDRRFARRNAKQAGISGTTQTLAAHLLTLAYAPIPLVLSLFPNSAITRQPRASPDDGAIR